jgi:VWFA-related protein
MQRILRTFAWRRFLCLVSCAVAIGAVVALHAQQAPPPAAAQADRQMPSLTFRVEINYVEVDAVVVDKQGQFVPDLKASDFQVFEDGKPQTVTNFGLVEIPVERADAPLFVRRPVEADVQSNVKPFDGRIYLIVLDELHTAPLHSIWVRNAAKLFINRSMGANDLAAVVSVQGRASQDFTSNKRLLTQAVDRFMGNGLDSQTESKIQDYNNKRAQGVTDAPIDPDEQLRINNASRTLGSLKTLSEYMASVHGRRKAVVLFSEGIGYDIYDVVNNTGASQIISDSRDAIGAATRANVSFYTVDPRGLWTADFGADSGGPPVTADPSLNLGTLGLQNEFRVEQDSLRTLADETGGFAILNSNDFRTAFDRLQKDNSNYYVLGYYPTNDRRDGRFRKLEVKVTRPGLQVRSRKGYVSPRGKPPAAPVVDAKETTPQELRSLLGSPLPIPGLRLTATAAAFKGKAPNASISLVVLADGRDLQFKEKDGKFEDTLDLAVLAVDESGGKSKGGLHHTLNMPLLPATYQQVVRNGLRITSRFDLPPGRYQLRIAASDANGQRAGSVHYDLEVPDFTDGTMTMSGLLLTSSLAGQVRTVNGDPDDEIRKALPGPPTVTREFLSNEEIALVAEVYDNELKTPHKVDITTSLRSDDGRELYKHADERASSELGKGGGGYGYTARVPLKGLSPGLYLLRVEARSRLGKGAAVSREVQIRVIQ